MLNKNRLSKCTILGHVATLNSTHQTKSRGTLTVIGWSNNSAVYLASSCLSAEPIWFFWYWTNVKRMYMQIQQPNYFFCHNQNTGFVNRMGQNVTKCRIGMQMKNGGGPCLLEWLMFFMCCCYVLWTKMKFSFCLFLKKLNQPHSFKKSKLYGPFFMDDVQLPRHGYRVITRRQLLQLSPQNFLVLISWNLTKGWKAGSPSGFKHEISQLGIQCLN